MSVFSFVSVCACVCAGVRVCVSCPTYCCLVCVFVCVCVYQHTRAPMLCVVLASKRSCHNKDIECACALVKWFNVNCKREGKYVIFLSGTLTTDAFIRHY